MAPRSGLASKHFIDTGAGVIDADYRGEVKVLLFNFSEVDFTVKQGDRIAQLVLERVSLLYLYSLVRPDWMLMLYRFIHLRLRSLRSWRRVFGEPVGLEVPVLKCHVCTEFKKEKNDLRMGIS